MQELTEAKPTESKITKFDLVQIPAVMHPLFRTHMAIQNGVERNLLFKTWGGLGDQICAEPTLRYALKMFTDCQITLASEKPELFSHLPFTEIFDTNRCTPVYDNYLSFETITPPDESNMVWLFFSHLLTNCVDFPSMCALRMQLPVKDREVMLPHLYPEIEGYDVVVHPGRHWPSKTFPKNWWDRVLSGLIEKGKRPVLIGSDTDDNRGTVDVETAGCLDLRNIHSITQTISLLKNSKVLLTNDSSPLHMAVDSDCWIGFFASCKHPDMITHWRRGEWSWRMENLSLGGIWDILDMNPNAKETIKVETVEPELLRSWLPEPSVVVDWVIDKL